MLGIVFLSALSALLLAALNYRLMVKHPMGTPLMVEIAKAIKDGADSFIRHEYSVIFRFALAIALVLALAISWQTAAAFLLGALMSGTAGLIGMRTATQANVRVSNQARVTKAIGPTLRLAFQGGSVMGLAVAGLALLGLALIFLVFGLLLGQAHPENLVVIRNSLGFTYIPFTMTVSGYALGCSIIAMFDRVGGGIFTKAADMGADLVGKTEAQIPEDDPRNPATIADNVGDNVGDVAGLGADLLESYVGAIISSVVLASYLFFTQQSNHMAIAPGLIEKLLLYPLLFTSIGLFSSIVGILSLLLGRSEGHPHRELNKATFISAGLTLVLTFFLTQWYFKGEQLEGLSFLAGPLSPWLAALAGIVSGIAIGQLAEYYTSYDFPPTISIADASNQGAAITITKGLAVGMKSTFLPVLVLTGAILFANYLAGLFGVAMAAVGMLSFVASTVSVDTYGPIADNAGGISEMSELEPEVREITDKLDSVGNTTAAIGKGFAIGSAALAALSLFASYLFSRATPGDTNGFQLVLNVIQPLTLAGALAGAVIPYLFSGILIDAVAKSAGIMVQNVRDQFARTPDILTGKVKPDYQECIRISSSGALKEMAKPALIAIITPIFGGFILGPEFVGGLLLGTTLSSILLALFTANTGGAWDNAKKLIESGNHGGKGSEAHKAAVIGDTVGDPLKDTVGPSLDILIKIMAVISLLTVSLFGTYNLIGLF